jgi:hypothetical protein
MVELQERVEIEVNVPDLDLEPSASLPAEQIDVMAFANQFDDPSVRGRIEKLESMMMSAGGQVELSPAHYFAKGLYAREIRIPKGTLLTGKIHKHEHLNIISQGEISVLTEHGPQRIKAPCTIVSQPGTKRVGYAHEDTVWTTIHATDETDVEKIDDELVVETFEQYQALLPIYEAKE